MSDIHLTYSGETMRCDEMEGEEKLWKIQIQSTCNSIIKKLDIFQMLIRNYLIFFLLFSRSVASSSHLHTLCGDLHNRLGSFRTMSGNLSLPPTKPRYDSV